MKLRQGEHGRGHPAEWTWNAGQAPEATKRTDRGKAWQDRGTERHGRSEGSKIIYSAPAFGRGSLCQQSCHSRDSSAPCNSGLPARSRHGEDNDEAAFIDNVPAATVTTITELADIDVLSNIAYSEGVPHGLLARLRADRPIHWQTIPDPILHDEAWVLTRHEDVLAASRDTDHFINGHGLNLRGDYSDDDPRHLLNLDDPEHLRLRRMINKGFTPKVVRRYQAHYNDLAGQLLDEAMAASDEFDVVEELAVALPLLAICELLGTTPDDRESIIAWSNAIITNDDPDYTPSAEARQHAAEQMGEYAMQMLADRRANPADDLATVLAQHLDRGELTEAEYATYVILLFVAGNETTRNNISHGLLQLAVDPSQYALLREGELYDTAVDEITRWASPVTYMSRTVTSDIDFGGHRFRAGDKVVLHYSSANRDESVFDDPMRFDISRDPNPHIAFGFGAHFCMGIHLAKLETRCLLEELVARVEAFELAEAEQYVRSSFVSGIKRLPIRVTARA